MFVVVRTRTSTLFVFEVRAYDTYACRMCARVLQVWFVCNISFHIYACRVSASIYSSYVIGLL